MVDDHDHRRPKIKESPKSPRRKALRVKVESELDDVDPTEAASVAACDPDFFPEPVE